MDKFVVDTSELKELTKTFEKLAGEETKKQFKVWVESMGFEFLDIIKKEIISLEVVDTRLLLTSFKRGDKNNIWTISEGGLTIDVGTNVKYAAFVNDGHFTTPEGVVSRWVPGYWEGNKFKYDKNAKTGMLLKRKWIEGTHYWESALKIFEKVFNKSLEKNLSQWLDKI
jgi:bacteriophage HK97-gp10 putative tail-component